MHATQRALRRAERSVDLRKARLKTRRAKLPLAKEPREKAAVVATLLKFDRISAFERRFMEFHLICPSGRGTRNPARRPAQIRGEAASGHVTLKHLQPHIGRVAEVLVGEAHADEPCAQTRDRLIERNLWNICRRQRPKQP